MQRYRFFLRRPVHLLSKPRLPYKNGPDSRGRTERCLVPVHRGAKNQKPAARNSYHADREGDRRPVAVAMDRRDRDGTDDPLPGRIIKTHPNFENSHVNIYFVMPGLSRHPVNNCFYSIRIASDSKSSRDITTSCRSHSPE